MYSVVNRRASLPAASSSSASSSLVAPCFSSSSSSSSSNSSSNSCGSSSTTSSRWARTRRKASSSCRGGYWELQRPVPQHVTRALFDPPPFTPDKLSVSYRVGGSWSSAPQPGATGGEACPRRCYTLTHNDITGALSLTVDTDYNYRQISGFYTRLLRDEVTAEWRFDLPSPSLHIYCYVNGKELWLAPAQLRNYIFRREIPLVLDTFVYADRHLLERQPELADAEVYVHFRSSEEELNKVELWGTLGNRSTWQVVPTSVLKRALWALTGQQFQQQQPQLTSTAPASSPSKALHASSLAAARDLQIVEPTFTEQQQQQQQEVLGQSSSNFATTGGAGEGGVLDEGGAAEMWGQQQQGQQQQQQPRQQEQQDDNGGQQGPGFADTGDGAVAPAIMSMPAEHRQVWSRKNGTSSSGGGSSHSCSSCSRSSSVGNSSRSRSDGNSLHDSTTQHRSVGFVALDKSELLLCGGASIAVTADLNLVQAEEPDAQMRSWLTRL